MQINFTTHDNPFSKIGQLREELIKHEEVFKQGVLDKLKPYRPLKTLAFDFCGNINDYDDKYSTIPIDFIIDKTIYLVLDDRVTVAALSNFLGEGTKNHSMGVIITTDFWRNITTNILTAFPNTTIKDIADFWTEELYDQIFNTNK